MIDEIQLELDASIEKAHDALKRELAKLRTGRAHPGLLDSVRVDYYGSPTPISQMAQISVPEPRTLQVKPWEKDQLKVIEKAIIGSNLGLNPQNDGVVIRIPMPPLTEERRKDIVKIAKKHGEDCKIAIRSARHEAMDGLDKLKKDGDVGEDAVDRAKKKVEDTVKSAGNAADDIVATKEKEILTV